MYVTAQQVKDACLAASIERIDHHACGCCGYVTAYLVDKDGNLYFDPGCDCGRWAPPEPRTWESAAAWINMQKRTGQWGDVAANIAAKFGVALPSVDA